MRGIAGLAGRDLKRVHEDVADLIELGLLERTEEGVEARRQDPYRHRNGVHRVVDGGMPDQRRPGSQSLIPPGLPYGTNHLSRQHGSFLRPSTSRGVPLTVSAIIAR